MSKLKSIRGFKVFNPDWSCYKKQYSCPGVFEEKGELELCKHGMHFCRKLIDCFDYYSVDPDNHVAEVIARGKIVQGGNKCCTDKLEIVRELEWKEVYEALNIGKNNKGNGNTGNNNIGEDNTGDCNYGFGNSGSFNMGSYNSGSGNFGIGNSGSNNLGSYNVGESNRGSNNIGSWNYGNGNNGWFNTGRQEIMLFNKPSGMTENQWWNSIACKLLRDMPCQNMIFVDSENMTDKEKVEHPSYEVTGGYLKELDGIESRQSWWDKLAKIDKDVIKAIPNFNPDIFEICTGIKVEMEEREVESDDQQ